jgi:hypothetical protein
MPNNGPAPTAQPPTPPPDFHRDVHSVAATAWQHFPSDQQQEQRRAWVISLIDETEWTTLDKDVKAEAFEGLLEKAASEGKKGAGQYFTPRVLIQSICRVMKPDPRVRNDFTIYDPAVGTAGFLVSAYEWLRARRHRERSRRSRRSEGPRRQQDRRAPAAERGKHHEEVDTSVKDLVGMIERGELRLSASPPEHDPRRGCHA